jgi:hypothetical protein
LITTTTQPPLNYDIVATVQNIINKPTRLFNMGSSELETLADANIDSKQSGKE